MEITSGSFVWDSEKELANIRKHGVDFVTAARVFKDPNRKIALDLKHSLEEPRLFAMGKVGERITYRGDKIRIFGAGYWRKGREYYEKKKSL